MREEVDLLSSEEAGCGRVSSKLILRQARMNRCLATLSTVVRQLALSNPECIEHPTADRFWSQFSIDVPKTSDNKHLRTKTSHIVIGGNALLAQHAFSRDPITAVVEDAQLRGIDAPLEGEWLPTIRSVEHEEVVDDDHIDRIHAIFFAKLFFFIILFDLDVEYFSLLSFIFFLHVNGVFQPVLRWYNEWRRRRVAIENRQQRMVREGLQSAQQDEAAHSAGEPEEADRPEAVAYNASYPFILKTVYQLVITFWCSLIPGWQPNRRYID